MNWLMMGLKVASRIPFERLIFRPKDAVKAEEEFLQSLERQMKPKPPPAPVPAQDLPESYDDLPGRKPVSAKTAVPTMERRESTITTEETIAYQRREIGKQMMLLETHLQQRCRIDGKPCDCCEKHPIVMEGLAQETIGMTTDPIYPDIVDWARYLSPITTQTASESGQYSDQYPELAIRTRELRKRMMGTTDLQALMSPEQQARAEEKTDKLLEKLRESSKEEGGKHGKPRRVQPG